jgi:hypothetical protein
MKDKKYVIRLRRARNRNGCVGFAKLDVKVVGVSTRLRYLGQGVLSTGKLENVEAPSSERCRLGSSRSTADLANVFQLLSNDATQRRNTVWASVKKSWRVGGRWISFALHPR